MKLRKNIKLKKKSIKYKYLKSPENNKSTKSKKNENNRKKNNQKIAQLTSTKYSIRPTLEVSVTFLHSSQHYSLSYFTIFTLTIYYHF